MVETVTLPKKTIKYRFLRGKNPTISDCRVRLPPTFIEKSKKKMVVDVVQAAKVSVRILKYSEFTGKFCFLLDVLIKGLLETLPFKAVLY